MADGMFAEEGNCGLATTGLICQFCIDQGIEGFAACAGNVACFDEVTETFFSCSASAIDGNGSAAACGLLPDPTPGI